MSGGAALSRPQADLAELLDRTLGAGVVVAGDLTLSLAGVELVYLNLRALLASVATLEAGGVPFPANGGTGVEPGPGPAEEVLFLAVVAAAFVVVLAFEAVRPVACFARVVCERERPAELDAERPLEPEAGALRALAIVSPFVRGRSQPSPRPARLKTVPAAA